MHNESIGEVGPEKYDLENADDPVKIDRRIGLARYDKWRKVIAAGLVAVAGWYGQEGITNYFEDREQQDEIVCSVESQKVAEFVRSEPELARDLIELHPDGSSFVSEETFSWCDSPASVVKETLADLDKE